MFQYWLEHEVDLSDAIMRCPSILTDLLEEYSNDWIEKVEDTCSDLDIDIDGEFNIVENTDG